ncbi:MAG: phosphatase PAP2 family protein [candidate division NC10 bacterium]|nr:phosphatase PAP2 family protein [candidate division NC10 bacterium]
MPVPLSFERLREWDIAGFHLIAINLQNGFFDLLMPFITDKWNFIAPLALLSLYLIFFRPRRDLILAISAVAVVLLADGTTQIFKDLVQRIRPCHVFQQVQLLHGAICTDSFSFPSNHASNTFALAAFISYNYRRLAIPSFLIAILVGYSRIYLTAHYPTDVLAGAAWGMLLGFTVGMVARRLMRFSQADEPPRTDSTKESLVSHTKPSQ